MSKAKLVQWYQSSEYVTASLKLRTLSPSETRRDIEGKFGERYCAIYEGGTLLHKFKIICINRWIVHVAYTVVLLHVHVHVCVLKCVYLSLLFSALLGTMQVSFIGSVTWLVK